MMTDHRQQAIQDAARVLHADWCDMPNHSYGGTDYDLAEAAVAAAEPHIEAAVRAEVAAAIRAEAVAAEGETDWGTSYWTQALHRAARIAEGAS